MAKTATDLTTGPLTFGAGQGLFEDGLQSVHEFSNFIQCDQTALLIDCDCTRWNPPDNSGVRCPLLLEPDRLVVSGEFFIDPDWATDLICYAEIETGDPGDEIQMLFEVGSSFCVVTGFTGAATLEFSDVIAVSGIGTGRQAFAVTIQTITGGGTTCRLRSFSIESTRFLATDIPSPT